MGILSSMHTGVSGLTAQGEAMGVIGDNIANAHTTGFKASRAEFSDIVSRNLKGVLGGNQIGRGTKIAAVNAIMNQGNTDYTDKGTDLAISGDGYFLVHGIDGDTYTRDGSFHFDNEGYLVTNDDRRVQGFGTDEKNRIVSKVGDIRFPKALTPAKATKDLNLYLNLDSRANPAPTFNVKDPYGTSNYSTGINIFDSQGNKHLVNFFFNKTGDRAWEYRGLVDGKEATGGKENEMSEVCKGKVTFNVDGVLETEEMTSSNFNFKGGALQNQQIKIDFGDSLGTDKGKGIIGTKQYGKESDLLTWNQNGSAAGNITNLAFNDDGILTALYDNGAVTDLGQIVLAKFENSEGLYKVGNNRFKESRKSGEPSVGAPGHAGRGTFLAKSLERSTVDLATEFVNLIQTQRGFQANAKTITTTDELLAEVIQLKR